MGVHQLIEDKRDEIEQLCRVLSVRRLDLFGPALGISFDAQVPR